MIEFINRKSMEIRISGRSTDFITPSFGFGCLYNCLYCYMKRHKKEGLTIANNTNEILQTIYEHCTWLEYPKIPNQTSDIYYTYDISCNEDFNLHLKYHNWKTIFDFFKKDNRIMASFATKYVNKELLTYNPENKIRVRLSLMPEFLRQILEANTSNIGNRLNFVNDLIENNYDVHLNFSPVIIHDRWLENYKFLFEAVDRQIKNNYKDKVKCEVIFLTHNTKKHLTNLNINPNAERFLWKPEVQENKISQYGGKNLRYKAYLKKEFINEFKNLHNSIIGWNTIRYIF
jgi:spore photoproduct lyase